MAYCCGAGMIGSFGTVRHYKTMVHHVPIMYCPVCDRIEVLPAIAGEYEILVEYAQGDNAAEVDFREFVSIDHIANLFENCVMIDEGKDFGEVLKAQIDLSLDLLGTAKMLGDDGWREVLNERLVKLSDRLKEFNKRKQISQRSA
ncbi:MAG: hypothetical protein ACM32O_12255 [Clostridia bacterium]